MTKEKRDLTVGDAVKAIRRGILGIGPALWNLRLRYLVWTIVVLLAGFGLFAAVQEWERRQIEAAEAARAAEGAAAYRTRFEKMTRLYKFDPQARFWADDCYRDRNRGNDPPPWPDPLSRRALSRLGSVGDLILQNCVEQYIRQSQPADRPTD